MGRWPPTSYEDVAANMEETRICYGEFNTVVKGRKEGIAKVRTSFNGASWESIARSLHMMRVPEYFSRILRNHLQNRTLVYETREGQKSVDKTADVPRGSILGPMQWNAIYDELLR